MPMMTLPVNERSLWLAALCLLLSSALPRLALAEPPGLDALGKWLTASGLEKTGLKAWPELKVSAGQAYRTDQAVLLFIDEQPGDGIVTFPRLNNLCRLVYWLGDRDRLNLRLTQTVEDWTIHLPQGPPEGAYRVVVLQLEGEPYLPVKPWVVQPDAGGSVTLPAHHSVTHGEFLQYEPQVHKNTVGYWVNPDDWAEWHFETKQPATYDVHILQGCGEGQGGSRVAFSVGDESMTFEVEDTGHFQNFRWRQVGMLKIPAGKHVLEVRVRHKSRNAVMDLRRIRLVPVK